MGKCQECKNDFKFQLQDIFCLTPGKEEFTGSELFSLKLNGDFIDHLCERLKLDFDETAIEGNLCFANSEEVRSDFRTTFNKLDIITFIAVKHQDRNIYSGHTEVLFPDDAISFWSEIKKYD